jgi:hypothetical protein
MSSRIGDLLLHPHTFFSGKSKETINLIPPFAFEGAGAVFIAIIHVLSVVTSSLLDQKSETQQSVVHLIIK